MGHVLDTYTDIYCLGIGPLREMYAKAGLTIEQKTPPKLTDVQIIREMIKAMGKNPAKSLSKEVMTDGATTQYTNEDKRIARSKTTVKRFDFAGC